LSSSSSALAGSVIDEHALGGATASGSVAADFAFNSVSNDDDLGVSQSDTLADENQVLSSDGSMYGEIYGPMDEGSGIHDSAFDDAIASGSEFASADFDSDVASHDDVAASDTGSDYHHDDTFDDMADDV
jgi:hypothetical protein